MDVPNHVFACIRCGNLTFTSYENAYTHFLFDPRHSSDISDLLRKFGTEGIEKRVCDMMRAMVITDEATIEYLKMVARQGDASDVVPEPARIAGPVTPLPTFQVGIFNDRSMHELVAVNPILRDPSPERIVRPTQTVRVKLCNAAKYQLFPSPYYFRLDLIGEKQTRANLLTAIEERYASDWQEVRKKAMIPPDEPEINPLNALAIKPPVVDWKSAAEICFVAVTRTDRNKIYRIKLLADENVDTLFGAWKMKQVTRMWTIVMGSFDPDEVGA